MPEVPECALNVPTRCICSRRLPETLSYARTNFKLFLFQGVEGLETKKCRAVSLQDFTTNN